MDGEDLERDVMSCSGVAMSTENSAASDSLISTGSGEFVFVS